MNDQETSETTATQSSAVDAETEEETLYTWEVWVSRELGYFPDAGYTLERVGELVNVETNWRPWPWNGEREGLAMIAHLGKGAGDYWLVCGDRVQRVSIVAETVYRLKEES